MSNDDTSPISDIDPERLEAALRESNDIELARQYIIARVCRDLPTMEYRFTLAVFVSQALGDLSLVVTDRQARLLAESIGTTAARVKFILRELESAGVLKVIKVGPGHRRTYQIACEIERCWKYDI